MGRSDRGPDQPYTPRVAPLQVAFDVGPLSGPRTGIGHAVASLATALVERDDVELHEYLVSWRAARGADGPIRLPIPALVAHRLWSRADHPRADRWLAGSDVIHGTNYVVPPSDIPRVVSVYDCWFLRNPGRASADVRRAGQVLRRSIATGALVHTSSRATAAALLELFPSADVTAVPLGVLPVPDAPERAPISGVTARRYVLSIGTIERRKNLPNLIRAFARIDHAVAGADPGDDLLLVIAGSDGDDRAAVDDAIDEVGSAVAARIVLTGRIDESGRAWLLRHASVLAYPSLDEGFGFPLLDAMQVGVPVVASDAGSIPEVAGDAALLAAPDDVDALAAGLSAAIGDEAVRARLVRAGAARWPTFTWAACAEGMTDLYRRAAGTPAAPDQATADRPDHGAVPPDDANRSRPDHQMRGHDVNSSAFRLRTGAGSWLRGSVQAPRRAVTGGAS